MRNVLCAMRDKVFILFFVSLIIVLPCQTRRNASRSAIEGFYEGWDGWDWNDLNLILPMMKFGSG